MQITTPHHFIFLIYCFSSFFNFACLVLSCLFFIDFFINLPFVYQFYSNFPCSLLIWFILSYIVLDSHVILLDFAKMRLQKVVPIPRVWMAVHTLFNKERRAFTSSGIELFSWFSTFIYTHYRGVDVYPCPILDRNSRLKKGFNFNPCQDGVCMCPNRGFSSEWILLYDILQFQAGVDLWHAHENGLSKPG